MLQRSFTKLIEKVHVTKVGVRRLRSGAELWKVCYEKIDDDTEDYYFYQEGKYVALVRQYLDENRLLDFEADGKTVIFLNDICEYYNLPFIFAYCEKDGWGIVEQSMEGIA